MFYQKKFGNGLMFFIISFILVFVAGSVVMADVIPVEVSDAAQRGFEVFRADNFNLGFCNSDDWKNIELGKGYQIFTIMPEKLVEFKNVLNSKAEDLNEVTFFSKAVPTSTWRFIVTSNDAPIALIYVAKVGENWKSVGIGSAGIAKEMGLIMSTFPKEQGYNLRFIRVFEAKSDILHVSQQSNKKKNTSGYAPLLSARIALDLDNVLQNQKRLMNEYEFISPLKDRVKNSVNFQNPEEK